MGPHTPAGRNPRHPVPAGTRRKWNPRDSVGGGDATSGRGGIGCGLSRAREAGQGEVTLPTRPRTIGSGASPPRRETGQGRTKTRSPQRGEHLEHLEHLQVKYLSIYLIYIFYSEVYFFSYFLPRGRCSYQGDQHAHRSGPPPDWCAPRQA